MFRQSSKSGLILPRSSMVNPYTAQGLPAIYSIISRYANCIYDFKQRTGSLVYDLSGKGNHGTLVPGASGNTTQQQMWDNGKPGGVDFDGVNDYITIPNSVRPSGIHTINIWVKYYGGSTYPGIFGGRSLGANNHQGGICITAWSISGTVYIYYDIYSSTNRYYQRKSIEAGKDIMITATYDGTDIKLYVNGSIGNEGTSPGGSLTLSWASATVTRLGSNVQNTTAQYLDGGIYSFFILDGYAMTQNDVIALYNAEKPFIK